MTDTPEEDGNRAPHDGKDGTALGNSETGIAKDRDTEDTFSAIWVAALSKLGRLRIISEDRASALVGEITPCFVVRRGAIVRAWRAKGGYGRRISDSTYLRRYGNFAVRVPGKAAPVWLPSWHYAPAEAIAAFAHCATMTDEELAREFPGFRRAAHDRAVAKRAAKIAAADDVLLPWLVELFAEGGR